MLQEHAISRGMHIQGANSSMRPVARYTGLDEDCKVSQPTPVRMRQICIQDIGACSGVRTVP